MKGALRADEVERWGGAARDGQEVQVAGHMSFEASRCHAPDQVLYEACREHTKGSADLVLGSVSLWIHDACKCGFDGGRYCPGSYARDVQVTGRYHYNDPRVLPGVSDPMPSHGIQVEAMCAIPPNHDER